MKLNQIHSVRSQPPQAPIDAQVEHLRVPVLEPKLLAVMPDLREQIVVVPTICDRLPDKLFTGVVALSGIDDIQTGIERARKQPLDRCHVGPLESDLRPA